MSGKRQNSIAKKLRLTIGIFLAVLFVSIAAVLNIYYRRQMLDNAILQARHEDEILNQNIASRISTTNSCCNTIIVELNNSLTAEHRIGLYPKLDTATQRVVYQSLLNTFTLFEDADQVCIIWDNGISIFKGRGLGYYMSTSDMPLYEELSTLGITKEGRWLTRINTDGLLQGKGQYFAKRYTDIDSGNSIGYIVMKLRADFDGLSSATANRLFYLFDNNNQLLQTNDAALGQQLYNEEDYARRMALTGQVLDTALPLETDERYDRNISSPRRGWTLLTVTDFRPIISNLNNTITYILVISVVAVLGLFIILNIVVQHIVTPIRKLSKHMVSLPDQPPNPLEIRHSNDEVGILIEHFNEMAQNNQELIQRVVSEQHLRQKVELALLQSQIKPHFLYNTLDTIYCLNGIGKHAEAKRLTKVLSDYYRRVLGKGMDNITLAEELDTVQKYLEIQTVRYSNVLSYTITQDGQNTDLKIPKLTLQPLVENAIYHGIKPTGKPGHIAIRLQHRPNEVHIRIEDDGLGMTGEQQEALLHAETGLTPNQGYGFGNVLKRLRLFYGDRVTVSFEDRPHGTCILIRILNLKKENARV